jgi:Holliday junction resolvase RusA-like endonuclease
MSPFTFVIPGQLPGSNEITRANRSHWAVGAQQKKKMEDLIGRSILYSQIKALECPVRVEIRWIEPDTKRDADNVSGAIKAILDEIVKMGILPDDSRKWVQRIDHIFEVDKQNPRIVVTLIPMGGKP